MTALAAVSNGQLSDASQLNQYRNLYRGGNVYDVVNGYGAVGDGVADDSGAIQAAIAAAGAAKGGTVFFPPGYYQISSTLTLPRGVHLIGTYMIGGSGTQFAGPGSQITQSSASTPIITLNAPAGTNQYNTQGSIIQGLRLSSSQDCIYAPCGAGQVRFADLEMVAARYGFYVRGQNQDWQMDNIDMGVGQCGFYLPHQQGTNANNHDVWFDKAYFRKVTIHGQNTGVEDGVRWHADDIEGVGPAPRSNHITWQNLVLNYIGHDSFVFGGGARFHTFITGNSEAQGYPTNTIYTTATTAGGSATVTVASGAGISNGNVLTIAGAGSVYNGWLQDWYPTVSSGGGTTTLVMTTTAPTTVTNADCTPNIYDVFRTVSTQGAAPSAIYFYGCYWAIPNAQDNVRYAYNNDVAGGNVYFYGCNTGRPVYDKHGLCASSAGGVGFRPVGAYGPPSVPASNTPFTNPITATMVYITGGTVTVIKVNGVTTGLTLTSGQCVSVRLNSSDTITMTYSVAPSWVWLPRFA